MSGREIQAVLFDLDGTLVDSHRALWDAYASFLRRRKREPTQEEFASLDGPTIPEIVRHLATAHDLDDDPGLLLAEYNDLLGETYARVPAMPVADRLLRTVGERFPIGLVTSASRHLVDPLLVERGWKQTFAVVVTGDEGNAKPDPALYRLAVARLGLPASRVVAVEDGVRGVQAARRAGLAVVGIGAGDDTAARLRDAGAKRVVVSLDDVLCLLG